MSDQDDQAEKSYEATPQKLLEARRKGEIARSAELLTAASYFGFFIALSVFGYASLMSVSTIFSIFIGQSTEFASLFFNGAATAPARALMQNAGWALAPLFGTPALAVLLVLFASRGIVFAPNKIAPKISKISIISNAKNKYGRSGLFQFLLSFSKLSIYSIVLAVFIHLRLEDMLAALHTNPFAIAAMLARLGMEFLFAVVIVSALIGAIDVIWQHFEHLRKNRMTRKEVLDETKNSEGDPHVKQERRQRAQSIAGMQMASEVAKADVIIVNPTHYAVALRWERQKGRAPVCVAKGIDEVAHRIREIAHENAVPVHSDPPTARTLHATTDIGTEIAPEHYRAVAAAIRFAEAMRLKAKGRI